MQSTFFARKIQEKVTLRGWLERDTSDLNVLREYFQMIFEMQEEELVISLKP